MKPVAVDLFCGAGGFTRGLLAAGFEIAAAVDNWQPALRSYRVNFRDHALYDADISQMQQEHRLGLRDEIDLVAGGPPCQGFSIQRIGSDQDDRNTLVFAFGQMVLALAPRMFIMENVPGLLGARGRDTLLRFVRLVGTGGYDTRHQILDAIDFGVPQFRRRVFVVGWRRGFLADFEFPRGRKRPNLFTVRDAISDLPVPPEDFSPTPGDPLHRKMRLSPQNIERLRLIPPGGGFEDLPPDMRVACHRNGAAHIGHRYVYGRLDPDRPAGTITARFDSFTRGRFAHPWEDRNISLREGARLQGFQDEHVFLGTQEEVAAQIGNAVPPALAEAVASAALSYLLGQTSTQAAAEQRSFSFSQPLGIQPQA